MKNKLSWLEAALLLSPFITIALLWNRLPSRFPMHWNARGEIDRWSTTRSELLLVPAIMIVVVALLHFLPAIDPRLRKTLQEGDRMHPVLRVLSLVFAAFSAVIFAIQLSVGFGYRTPHARLVIAATLLLLAVIGNYLGNLRPNYFAGIRTPWTLESAATWRATHRLGGRLIFAGALLLLGLQFFLSSPAFAVVLISATVLLVLWAFLYSWYHFRRHHAAGEH